ncbi:M14/M99 family metallopeptidase [Thiohalorhabdus methylotrophus]|uniref:M14/M99 family metallopeptidase n=1 Tax=Thiohalorhabdus methylotrophus TaxID=3242694 RepID=A0ABV4U0H2_9GAMM
MKRFGGWLLALAGVLAWGGASGVQAVERPSTQHEVHFAGTNYELNIYRIHGRHDGKTLLIVGGIQGDEPGAFMSADFYSDLSLQKGNLIVVPRANLKSIILDKRGADGDMNRRFLSQPRVKKEMDRVVRKLKKLMGEADLFLHLHDGWGFHYPEYVSKWRNPKRYGQSIITDANRFPCENGTELDLKGWAKGVLKEVNARIPKEKHHLHYFNTHTWKPDTPFPSMKKTATWYALRKHCTPAFGVEASKHLPTLEMKVRHHNYVINAFMERLDIVPESPQVFLPEPRLRYAVVQVNGEPRTLQDGQTLWVEKGDRVGVTEIQANYERGLSCDVAGYAGLNDLGKAVKVQAETRIVFRKDNEPMAAIPVRLNGRHKTEHRVFLVEINGEERVFLDGATVDVGPDDSLRLVKTFGDSINDMQPKLNFKGWVPEQSGVNDGDDRGYEIAMDGAFWSKYSRRGRGRVYPVVAVNGEDEEIGRIWVRVREETEQPTEATAQR